jgi:hypothetical protein
MFCILHVHGTRGAGDCPIFLHCTVTPGHALGPRGCDRYHIWKPERHTTLHTTPEKKNTNKASLATECGVGSKAFAFRCMALALICDALWPLLSSRGTCTAEMHAAQDIERANRWNACCPRRGFNPGKDWVNPFTFFAVRLTPAMYMCKTGTAASIRTATIPSYNVLI